MSVSTRSLTVADVLNDIEIELLQGAVTRDDLGQSVQNVRRFQNQVRGEMLDKQTRPDYRAVANRQFQINDMLLTLAQEMATRQAALELELHKAMHAGLRRDGAPLAAPGANVSAANTGAGRPQSEDLVRRLGAVQAAMRDDALALQLEVTPEETPVIGRLLGSARAALHSLVVFYTNRLASRQAEVNHTYGDTLRWLLQARAADQESLELLAAEVAKLRARLDGQPPASPPPASPPPASPPPAGEPAPGD
jgi:hypothetical protein